MRAGFIANALFGAMLWMTSAVQAQTADEVAAVRGRLAHEPAAEEVVREALHYFRVHPEAFDEMRSAARARGLLPLLATGYRFDDNKFSRAAANTMGPTLGQREENATNIHAVTVGAVWDLRELVFNPAEVQVYGIIGVQRDLMLEVTRTYYMRRQLYLRLLLRPPEDAIAQEALRLRVEEFTALLDVLTGGWFTRTSNQRARTGRR